MPFESNIHFYHAAHFSKWCLHLHLCDVAFNHIILDRVICCWQPHIIVRELIVRQQQQGRQEENRRKKNNEQWSATILISMCVYTIDMRQQLCWPSYYYYEQTHTHTHTGLIKSVRLISHLRSNYNCPARIWSASIKYIRGYLVGRFQ